MSEIGNLSVKISADTKGLTTELNRAERSLKGFDTGTKQGTKSVNDFSRANQNLGSELNSQNTVLSKVTGRVIALAGAYVSLQGAMRIVDTAAQFQALQASLQTVTGSAEEAVAAFDQIKTFAATTPFALTEVTDAFIKMKALGLDPSARALTAYGDTASSMGKSLDQMIEAVAGATTGQFERLRAFGIRASSEGDRVTFTFRGVATEVGKNSAEIERYLMGLGETNFAGGMARQMETIGGQLSNLGDQWDRTFAAIGDSSSGLIGGVIAGLAGIGSAIEDLFLSTEELTKKYNQVATAAEVLSSRQFTLTRQISDQSAVLFNAQQAMDVYKQAFVNMGLEVDTTTDYYKQLKASLDEAKAGMDALQSSMAGLQWSAFADDEFAEIDKQFKAVADSNAMYAEQMRLDKLAQEEQWLKDKRVFDQEHLSDLEAMRVYREVTLARQLDALRAAGLDELDVLNEKHFTELEQLQEFLENKLVTQKEYDQLFLESVQRREDAINAIEVDASRKRQALAEIEASNRQKAVQDMMNNLTSLMNSGSREMFEIGKTAAIAETIVNTYKSATGAYSALASIPIVGPALGAAAAASAVAAGMSQVSNIKSQTFSRGGGGSGASPSSPSVTSGVAAQAQGVNGPSAAAPGGGTLTVQGLSAGSLLTGDMVASLAEELLDYQRRGGNVVLAR